MLILILELFIRMPCIVVQSLESHRGQIVWRAVKCVSCVSFFKQGQEKAGLRRPCRLLWCWVWTLGWGFQVSVLITTWTTLSDLRRGRRLIGGGTLCSTREKQFIYVACAAGASGLVLGAWCCPWDGKGQVWPLGEVISGLQKFPVLLFALISSWFLQELWYFLLKHEHQWEGKNFRPPRISIIYRKGPLLAVPMTRFGEDGQWGMMGGQGQALRTS